MLVSLDDNEPVYYLNCKHIYNDDGYIWKCRLDNVHCVLDCVGLDSCHAMCLLYEVKDE